MSDYIERERIEKFFDGIYDCADLTFEPYDQCCAADDCSHCKWYETKNAIKKRILSIPAADVRTVIYCKECKHRPAKEYGRIKASKDADGYTDYKCPFVCEDPWYNRMPADDDYCSCGEKREES